MKEVWEQIAGDKKPRLSAKEAQAILQKRFPKSTLKDAFTNSEIFKLYQSQVNLLIQTQTQMGDLEKASAELQAKVEGHSGVVSKLQKDLKDALAAKDSVTKAKDGVET